MNSEIKTKELPKRTFCIHIGLQSGYTKTYFSENDVNSKLAFWMKIFYQRTGVRLFPAISKYELTTFANVTEPHLALRFVCIQPTDVIDLEEEFLKLARELMLKFDQNRMMLELENRVILLERSDEFDS